jgi:sugar lactone lactonase YvrE
MTSQTLVSGLCFGEGPRWHDGRLWLSDMHDHQVIAVDEAGSIERIVEVPHQPSGLGWLPGGDLLVVSMTNRQLLRFDGRDLSIHADLSTLASFHCNDMVVDDNGRAYVGNFGFDLHGRGEFATAPLIAVESNGDARVVATDLGFPNGTVITPDGSTLIVAESFSRRLTAFDILDNGDLDNRRVWAELPENVVPDGICLDDAMGVWLASPTSNESIRVAKGGEVTDRASFSQGAYACMLGGADGQTLFTLTAADSAPDACREARSGTIEVTRAPHARAGLP